MERPKKEEFRAESRLVCQAYLLRSKSTQDPQHLYGPERLEEQLSLLDPFCTVPSGQSKLRASQKAIKDSFFSTSNLIVFYG